MAATSAARRPDGKYNATQNDLAHLLPTVRPELNLPSFMGTGFLAWDPGGKYGGESSQAQLQAQFTEHVVAAGEIGCGYEATLEAWYRFLIDPSPPLNMVVNPVDTFAYPEADADGNILVDNTVLTQRAAFLRPDSLVAIIMLTDENDCSVVDGGIGYLTSKIRKDNGESFQMFAATQACDANPNDKCCRSCGLNEASPPSGCSSLADDPGCIAGRAQGTDSLNLRCFNQKQRFGFDLLYSTDRYVSGLRDPLIYDTHLCKDGTCPQVPNPLFAVGDAPNPRDQTLVFLAGIVGVPWQDIATDASFQGGGGTLEYLTAAEMNAASPNRWDVVLGHPEADNPKDPSALPLDPLMIETSNPRTRNQPGHGGRPRARNLDGPPGQPDQWARVPQRRQFGPAVRLHLPVERAA